MLGSLRLKKIKRLDINLILGFFIAHIVFLIFISDFVAFSPDEKGYIGSFTKIYSIDADSTTKGQSGWINTPTFFLWIAYAPAKFLHLLGVDELIAVRILSSLIVTYCFYVIKTVIFPRVFTTRRHLFFLILAFFTPSFFLWSSLGLREIFIFFSLTLFFYGLSSCVSGNYHCSAKLLIIGSYILISVKFYLWLILCFSIILTILFYYLRKNNKFYLKLFRWTILIPFIFFVASSSPYTLQNLYSSSIGDYSERPGDSIIVLSFDQDQDQDQDQDIAFHGNSTIIELYWYFENNSNSNLSKILTFLGIKQIVYDYIIKSKKVALENKIVGLETKIYSSEKQILAPAKINEPFSILHKSFLFLIQPIPFLTGYDLMFLAASTESPIWWVLYGLTLLKLIRFGITRLLNDPMVLTIVFFLLGFIFFSAITEVNFGTAYRHRSVIMIPIVFIYARIIQLERKSL
jgi:hypothetical protein